MSHLTSLHLIQIVCLSYLKVLIRFLHKEHDRCPSAVTGGVAEGPDDDVEGVGEGEDILGMDSAKRHNQRAGVDTGTNGL